MYIVIDNPERFGGRFSYYLGHVVRVSLRRYGLIWKFWCHWYVEGVIPAEITGIYVGIPAEIHVRWWVSLRRYIVAIG